MIIIKQDKEFTFSTVEGAKTFVMFSGLALIIVCRMGEGFLLRHVVV